MLLKFSLQKPFEGKEAIVDAPRIIIGVHPYDLIALGNKPIGITLTNNRIPSTRNAEKTHFSSASISKTSQNDPSTVTNKLIVEKDLAKTLLKKQDEILTLLIKERFAKSATLKSANFDVKTEEGIVQLNGTVRFQVSALEAAEAARQVPGVRPVNTEKIRLEGES